MSMVDKKRESLHWKELKENVIVEALYKSSRLF
jgi:hypothetical protein